MAFATMNASPPRTCRMRNAPPGKEKHSRMRNAPPGKEKPHAKCSPWKGKAQPHAKCSPLERENRMRNAPSRKGIHFQLISC